MKVSVIVLTKNEGKNIAACLQGLQWCDEIIIIDDHSTDQTVTLSHKLKAKVYQHKLNNDFSQQRNFGLEKATGDWVLFVDADERVSEELKTEILKRVKDEKYEGFYIKRLDFMWGKVLQYGETGNIKLLRLAKRNSGRWIGKVHEVWKVNGNLSEVKNPIMHYPHQTLAEFLQEINFYTTLRAQELFMKRVHVAWWHMIAYPKAKFIQNYFFKQGFRDGIPGLILALCMSLHSFLVRGKLWQLRQEK